MDQEREPIQIGSIYYARKPAIDLAKKGVTGMVYHSNRQCGMLSSKKAKAPILELNSHYDEATVGRMKLCLRCSGGKVPGLVHLDAKDLKIKKLEETIKRMEAEQIEWLKAAAKMEMSFKGHVLASELVYALKLELRKETKFKLDNDTALGAKYRFMLRVREIARELHEDKKKKYAVEN